MATLKTARKIEPAAKAPKADLSVVEGAPPEAAPPPRRRRLWRSIKWLLIIALLGGSGGGAWWYYFKAQPTPAQAPSKGRPTVAPAKSKAEPKPPQFVSLEPFTVNLLEENGDHYLQASIVLQVSDDKSGETIRAYMPVVRDRILRVLSGLHPSEILVPTGKQKLAETITAETRAILPGDGDKGLLGTFFGAFVVQ